MRPRSLDILNTARPTLDRTDSRHFLFFFFSTDTHTHFRVLPPNTSTGLRTLVGKGDAEAGFLREHYYFTWSFSRYCGLSNSNSKVLCVRCWGFPVRVIDHQLHSRCWMLGEIYKFGIFRQLGSGIWSVQNYWKIPSVLSVMHLAFFKYIVHHFAM